MAFTAKSTGNSNRVEQPVLDPGNYPARLVKIVTLGLQEQRAFKGEPKKPAEEIDLTFELVDAFTVNEDGEEQEDKPRWLSITIPFYSLDADRAKSTLFYKTLDPDLTDGGDWSKQIGKPVSVSVGEYVSKKDGKRKNQILGLTRVRPAEAKKMTELKNDPVLFDFDEPDMEVYAKLPPWQQEKLQGSLRFAGSPLAKALKKGADKEEPVKEAPVEEPEEGESDDDAPW